MACNLQNHLCNRRIWFARTLIACCDCLPKSADSVPCRGGVAAVNKRDDRVAIAERQLPVDVVNLKRVCLCWNQDSSSLDVGLACLQGVQDAWQVVFARDQNDAGWSGRARRLGVLLPALGTLWRLVTRHTLILSIERSAGGSKVEGAEELRFLGR